MVGMRWAAAGAGKVGRGNRAADHDVAADTEVTQLDALVDRGDAVAEWPLRSERREDVLRAETVPATLHHGNDPDSAPDVAPDASHVAADGSGVHLDPGSAAGAGRVGRGQHGRFAGCV